jgi:hypothetical protein
MYGVCGFISFYVPDDGFPALARRVWPGASTRFLAPSLALVTVAAMPAVAALSRQYSIVAGILAGFILWDMMISSSSVPENFPVAVGVSAAIAPLLAIAVNRRPWTVACSTKSHIALCFGIAVLLGVCLLQRARSDSRWLHYKNSTDVAWIPRDFVQGWRYCDQVREPMRIALTAGWEHRGQNWFFYPLLGSKLQNTVTYISPHDEEFRRVRSDGSAQIHEATFSTWLRNLNREKIDTVFVQKPWPVEERWINEHSDKFHLLLSGDSFKIYRLL